ncbi:YjfI family protein, partial [Aquicoccus porphyridii]|uniref:YjfI family protein n=1 Tax=Aquicoccus porphyridii TaxID=1852029 RepID=UPI001CAA8250
ELFSSGEAQIELIEGAEASLYVIMREYGDLPVFVAPQGEQIIVEALLWPESDVTDATAFNEEVLLSRQELFSSGEAQIELIEGAEASLYVIMREYGDLPVFVAPQGEQIIVEALLWPESDVTDATAFNEEVLLSRQLFPLSSIGLLNLPGEERCYSMFGALSTTSSLASVLHEIETLAGNVIRATEVYAGYLKARA